MFGAGDRVSRNYQLLVHLAKYMMVIETFFVLMSPTSIKIFSFILPMVLNVISPIFVSQHIINEGTAPQKSRDALLLLCEEGFYCWLVW